MRIKFTHAKEKEAKMKDNQLHPLLSKALKNYALRADTNFEGALRDVLTELYHIADEHGVDFQERVGAAVEVSKEEKVEREEVKEFEVELYELHASKVSVHAKDKAEAILKAVHGQGDPIDDTCEYVEMADGYGMTANDAGLALNEEELAKVTKELGIQRLGIIPTLRQIEEVG